jgi:hypothetical protein
MRRSPTSLGEVDGEKNRIELQHGGSPPWRRLAWNGPGALLPYCVRMVGQDQQA